MPSIIRDERGRFVQVVRPKLWQAAAVTRPLALPKCTGDGGRIPPRQNFRTLNLLAILTPTQRRLAISLQDRLDRFDQGRPRRLRASRLCVNLLPVLPRQRECPQRTTGLLKRSARRLVEVNIPWPSAQ